MWQSGKGTGRSPGHATARAHHLEGSASHGGGSWGPRLGGGGGQAGTTGWCPACPSAGLRTATASTALPQPWPTSTRLGPERPGTQCQRPHLPTHRPTLILGRKSKRRGGAGAGHHLCWTLAPIRAVFFNLGEQRVRGHQTAPCTQQAPGQMTPTAAHRRRAGAVARALQGWTKG